MEKIIVSICDDDFIIHEVIQHLLERHYGKQIEIIHYYNANELIDNASMQQVVLMDIDMPEVDGITASHLLKKSNNEVNIIMLTSKIDRFKDAFKIGATRFVTKPIDKSELFEAIDHAIKIIMSNETITVLSDGKSLNIKQNKIYMFEASRNRVVMYLKDHSLILQTPLKSISDQLNKKNFLRVHKSYIINMNYVSSVNNREIILDNSIRASISFRKEKEVTTMLMNHDLNEG